MLPIHDDMWILYKNRIPTEKVKLVTEIPRMNPLGVKYRKWWSAEKRKCIEGLWVEHKGDYKFVSGPLYWFVNYWRILLNPKNAKSKIKRLGVPFLRDLEWIKSQIHEEVRAKLKIDIGACPNYRAVSLSIRAWPCHVVWVFSRVVHCQNTSCVRQAPEATLPHKRKN